MKILAIISLAVFLMASPLFAAGITDATKPLGHMKFSANVEDNYIFDRDMEIGENLSKFDFEDVNQIYAKLALGLTPYFNVYAKLGASDSGDIKHYDTSGMDLDIETEYGLLWGVGISGVREISDGWKIGLDAQFDWWKSDVDSMKFIGTPASNVSGEIENFEFQGTPFITRKFDLQSLNWAINPYLGVKFSYFRTETDKSITYTGVGTNRTVGWTLKGDDYVGIVVGSDVEINPNLALQVEGRFIDETAITAGGTYRF